MQLHLQLGQLRVGLLDDGVDVGDGLFVLGDLAQVLGALLDLELFLDLAPEVLAELLQLLRQRRVREVRLDAVLDAQLVEQTQAEVVVLKEIKKNRQVLVELNKKMCTAASRFEGPSPI